MPPDPAVSFTIPSIYDDTELECRIYHPSKFSNDDGTCEDAWLKKGAIIAHPYATLGGCFDDHVVLALVTEILKLGFVVGTFNFRGAGASKGRTSWSAKAERLDYASFVGLFAHYLNDLEPPVSTIAPVPTSPTSHKLTTIKSSIQTSGGSRSLTLILGGYSYGSLIVTLLPPVDAILDHFKHVTKGTVEAEIRLRATHLARNWNAQARAVRKRGRTLHVDDPLKSPRSAIFGGEESDPGTRRGSRDSRKSLDGIRRSLDRSRSRLSIGRKLSRDKIPHSGDDSHTEELLESVDMPPLALRYLLVSPLSGPVWSFLTMFSKQWPFRKEPERSPNPKDRLSLLPTDEQFWHYPTFAIYGDSDGFTSQQKMRKWTDQLKAKSDSLLTSSEVSGAGHFWIEIEEEATMKKRIKEWVLSLDNRV